MFRCVKVCNVRVPVFLRCSAMFFFNVLCINDEPEIKLGCVSLTENIGPSPTQASVCKVFGSPATKRSCDMACS